jgi:hypothetical protein
MTSEFETRKRLCPAVDTGSSTIVTPQSRLDGARFRIMPLMNTVRMDHDGCMTE